MKQEEHPHQQASLHDSRIEKELTVRETYQIRALAGKIWDTQKKSIGTLICQITTPLLCLLFTVLVTMIVKNNVSTKIAKPAFPQPFNIPGAYSNKTDYLTTCDQYYFYSSSNTVGKSPESLLQRSLTKYCPNVSDIRPKFYHKDSFKQMNDEILQSLKKADDPSQTTQDDATIGIPDGVMQYHKISANNLSVTVAINDMRIGRYHRSNGVTRLLLNESQSDSSMINSYLRVTEGGMSLIDLVTKTYLNSYVNTQTIASSFMYMPFKQQNSFVLRVVNVIGNSLNPMAISLLIPMILFALVSERESRLLQMMRMNGLDMKYYWFMNSLFYVGLSLITFGIFYFFGAIVFRIELFQNTSPLLFCILFFGWSLSQVSMASFLQLFLQKSRSALIVGYSIAIFATLVGQILSTMIFPYPSNQPTFLTLLPPFALSRVFYLLSFACANGSCYSKITAINGEVIFCLIVIYVSSLIFPIIIYIYESLNKFLDKFNIWSLCSFSAKTVNESAKSNVFEDQTVQKQRQVVNKLLVEELYSPLMINQVTKKYQTLNGASSFALQSTSLNVNQDEVIGLLGPSGSGKTTLISLVTGTVPLTSGTILFDGNIPDKKLNKQIGVCPQFDLLWPQLSPKQHLIFYSRLKGINEKELQNNVFDMLNKVDLGQLQNRPVSSLSGGMKRRLSIAIALAGDPRIVMLDQPASGLDPQHRRQLWDIILDSRKGKAILLTTHSLQEAQVLCSRIGILIGGVMRCVGKIPDLKIRLGKGYNLSINMKKTQQVSIEQSMKKLQNLISQNNIPVLQKHQFHRTINYYIDRKQVNLGKLFELLIKNKDQLFIEDWALQQPSLYDVFIRLVDESELDK